MKLSRPVFLFFAWLSFLSALAQAPSGYYTSAEGKNKKTLLQSLHNIISDHENVGYKGLWTLYKTSDIRPGTNTIWDIYSTASFTVGRNQCGSYSEVGDCYNREHSFPKSWFDDASPMYSDAFHIYPTDGKVNNQRSNYPYGECAGGATLSAPAGIKALGKLGNSTTAGFNGTVFEPVDEYKGDLARTYFYMATCYNDRIAGWSNNGHAKDILAGNSYPVYKEWYLSLMLKWHRQDPVSQKEIDRNNAIYKAQHNRNPYIDHPELAEYIWGDKQNESWKPGSGAITPTIIAPSNGSEIDMGITATGKMLSIAIPIEAQGLTSDLTASVSGEGFSILPSVIAKDAANAGTAILTASYTGASPKTATATLSISGDGISSVTVALRAQTVDGIPAQHASNVTTDSFTARWTDIDNDSRNYRLSVFYADGTTLLPGYPADVAAAAGQHTVANLDDNTTYKYYISDLDGSKRSNTITVTTAALQPVISAILPSGELNFTTEPQTPSEPLPVDIETEYVNESLTVTITGNFEISSDKQSWSKTLSIAPSGERIYVRMPALDEGQYTGVLSASTATVSGFEIDVDGTVAATPTFFEDFEQESKISGYEGGTYQGTAATWQFTNTGIFGRNNQDHFNGKQAACFAKSGTSAIEMTTDKSHGAGVFSFRAAPFKDDEAAKVTVEYSTNNGSSWTELATFNVVQSSELKEYRADAKISGNVRFRLSRKDGKRANIDDIAISNYVQASVDDATAEQWDAYALGGKIHIEPATPSRACIYSLDGRQVWAKSISQPESVALDRGIYIVVISNDSRKVVLR